MPKFFLKHLLILWNVFLSPVSVKRFEESDIGKPSGSKVIQWRERGSRNSSLTFLVGCHISTHNKEVIDNALPVLKIIHAAGDGRQRVKLLHIGGIFEGKNELAGS